MANNVFANGLEIACKSADGKSSCAFPDPCWTNNVVVPYANTAYAKDTSNASKTVFISSKPVMKKDVSYFKTSTGNEPANGLKGCFTSVKKGKAYFTSWSMNVKFEGENVDRHKDGMTHNHGSKSGNTSIWVYSDTGIKPPKECIQDCINIEEACGEKTTKAEATKKCGGKNSENSNKEKEEKEEKARKKRKGLIIKVKELLKKNKIDIPMKKPWKMTHCVPCSMFKPGLDLKKQIDCILKQKKKLETARNKMNEVFFKGSSFDRVNMLVKAADYDNIFTYAVENIFLKKIKFLEVPSDIYKTAKGKDKISAIKNIISEGYKSTVETIQSIELIEEYKDKYEKASVEEIISMAEYCEKKGKNSILVQKSCLEQRKCLLEPYEDSTMPKSLLSKNGCCPGQTAHHLIPNSMFQKAGQRGKKDANIENGCTKYSDKKSPNVCVYGYSQSIGSHKKIHLKTKNGLQSTLDSPTKKMTYEIAKSAAINAHEKVFEGAKCDKLCLEKQLDNYYKKACPDIPNPQLRKVNGMTKKQYEDTDDYCQ